LRSGYRQRNRCAVAGFAVEGGTGRCQGNWTKPQRYQS
jgi:hypothetical protein